MELLEQFYIDHKDDLYRYLLWLCGDKHLSEDLMQKTFIKAMKGLPSFRGESSVRTWLKKIARHTWIDHLKKEKKMQKNELDENIPAGDDLRLLFEGQEAAKRVKEILTELSDREQTTITMRLSGFSFAEIATALEISENSCRVIDFRGRKKIREVLTKEGLI